MSIKCAIVGASGYTGLELIKILIGHSEFELAYVANSEGGIKLSEIHRSMQNIFEVDIEKADAKEIAKRCELAFLALPHKSAMSFAKELLELGVKVVDLSADYRLELETYEKNYCTHEDSKNLKNAAYGLPEYYRDDIKNSSLVANPGCYPTAILLAILPFMDYLDLEQPIFIDAKTGVSGAGKKCVENTHFVTINENIFAYSPLTHRHTPEIVEKIEKIKNLKPEINFIPHLLPITRGMLVSIYAKLSKDIEPLEVLKEHYKGEEFIRIEERAVDVKSTSGTNFCNIFALKNKNALFINSSIDNLLRGASSQAVVNANIMYGFKESLGIPKISYSP